MQGDRLSQLQERVYWMSNQFYTYVGVLQRDAPPKFDDPEGVARTAAFSEMGREFATNIIQTNNEIMKLIDALPGINVSEESQYEILADLEMRNAKCTKDLERRLQETDRLLEGLREVIDDITEDCKVNSTTCFPGES